MRQPHLAHARARRKYATSAIQGLNGARVNASSLLLSGLFPGDAILEVNCERVKVEAITRVAPDSGEGGGSHHKSVSSSLVLQRIGTFINYCMCIVQQYCYA